MELQRNVESRKIMLSQLNKTKRSFLDILLYNYITVHKTYIVVHKNILKLRYADKPDNIYYCVRCSQSHHFLST